MAGLARGTTVVVRADLIVVEVVLPAAEGRGGAAALLGGRMALAEEPLHFLMRRVEGQRDQHRPLPGILALADLGELLVEVASSPPCGRLRSG